MKRSEKEAQKEASTTKNERIPRKGNGKREKGLPLCIKVYCLNWKGWQLVSLVSVPGVAARTWAKKSGEEIFSANRCKLILFQAGVTLNKH